jgi:hypothetical protein
MSSTFVTKAHALDSTREHPSEKILFQGETLTVTFTSTSLRQVMEELSRVSSVQIRWLDTGGNEPVTVDLVALPLSQAIPQLLRDRNFLLFYSSTKAGARLTQVWISSQKKGTTQLSVHSQSPSQESSLLTANEPDPTEEAFVPPDMLLQTALYDRGSAARLEAITRLEEYASQDPRIVEAFSHLAHTDPNADVQHAAATALQRLEEE